ncbi:P30/P32 family tip organella adhesin [Mycoplasmoides gallisepticum]|uniref:P30/P32 family tip organella adhesin n=1 Tax=Mycoplasmoides gallisepticum TaxID=2096 RepID=UPI001EF647F8|nr:P30/P32 family tip organella adhesin [Mycoplasmoides gallisepticum]ULH67780.1 adhesin [Mycoplasmoides gallisepticum]
MFSLKKLKSKLVGVSFVFSGAIALGTGVGLTSEHKYEHSPTLVLHEGETNSVGPRKITFEPWFYPVVGAGAGLIVVSLLLGLGIGIPIAKKKERMMIQEREEHQKMVESLGIIEQQNKTEAIESTAAVPTEEVNTQEPTQPAGVNVDNNPQMGINQPGFNQPQINPQFGPHPQQRINPQGFGGPMSLNQMGMRPGFNQMPPQMGGMPPRPNFPNQMPNMNQPRPGFRPQPGGGAPMGNKAGGGFNHQGAPMGPNRMNFPNQGMNQPPHMAGPRAGFPPQNGPR